MNNFEWLDVNVKIPDSYKKHLCVVEMGVNGVKQRQVRILYNSPCAYHKWDIKDGGIVTHWANIPSLPSK